MIHLSCRWKIIVWPPDDSFESWSSSFIENPCEKILSVVQEHRIMLLRMEAKNVPKNRTGLWFFWLLLRAPHCNKLAALARPLDIAPPLVLRIVTFDCMYAEPRDGGETKASPTNNRWKQRKRNKDRNIEKEGKREEGRKVEADNNERVLLPAVVRNKTVRASEEHHAFSYYESWQESGRAHARPQREPLWTPLAPCDPSNTSSDDLVRQQPMCSHEYAPLRCWMCTRATVDEMPARQRDI